MPEAPYGSWPSPITATAVATGADQPGEIRADGPDIWWSESRASEAGRVQLVRRQPETEPRDVLPDGWSVRTRVHEYGGGAWAVRAGTVVFASWDDQRLYRYDPERRDAPPVALTPAPSVRHGLRYAELSITPDGAWVVCVRESHEPAAVEAHGEAVNEIVAVPLDGSAAGDPVAVRCVAAGADFFAGPTVSPDGQLLAFVAWNHPDMPWDDTELHVAAFAPAEVTTGIGYRVADRVPSKLRESVVQPTWGPDRTLWWSSDAPPRPTDAAARAGWWNLQRARIQGPQRFAGQEALAPATEEIGGPHWVFGQRWFAVLDAHTVVASATSAGIDHLVLVSDDGRRSDLRLPFTHLSQVVPGTEPGQVLVVGASPTEGLAPWRVRIDTRTRTAEATPLAAPPDPVDEPWDRAAWTSAPEPLEFASTGGRTAHALLYRPKNPDTVAPAGTLPPLLVLSHGGPTSAARAMYKASTQFWTSRGFLVADVNYGGSTGYGRPYRDLLQRQWGVVDTEDCLAVARHLVAAGEVDPAKLAIRGGSAGGYTTLCALTFGDVFAAGASHYGVADLAALATDTHKFESRYLDGLVGPWPEAEAVYRERSPIHHTDRLSCPLIVLQGLEDEVVPPAQAEAMVAALAAKGLPHAYLPFEGEQHGFRRSENIIRALEAELWFYGKVFDFVPADAIEPVAGAVGFPS